VHAAGAGVKVHPAERDPTTGKIRFGTLITHLIMLSGIYADSPARAKLMYTVASWTSYFTCPFCKLIGTSVEGVVRFLGYSEPVHVDRGPHKDNRYSMGAADEKNRLHGSGYLKWLAEFCGLGVKQGGSACACS
jgi:hypothetical protein